MLPRYLSANGNPGQIAAEIKASLVYLIERHDVPASEVKVTARTVARNRSLTIADVTDFGRAVIAGEDVEVGRAKAYGIAAFEDARGVVFMVRASSSFLEIRDE